MGALVNLLSGRPDFWFSIIVILFILGMGVFFVVFFLRHIRREDAERRRH